MRQRRIVYQRVAQDDLRRIRNWMAVRVSRQFAKDYLQRIRRRIDSLEYGAERGTPRDDIRTGIRVIGLMQSISIAFAVKGDSVVIFRVMYGGQDWQADPTTDDED